MSIPINALVDYLYKKSLGVPQTNPNTDLNAELGYSSVPHIFESQNYAQFIPKPAPNDWIPSGSNIQWSAQYPYIYKYTLLTLQAAIRGNNAAFRHNLLQNIIPRSYHLSYKPRIYTNNVGSTEDERYDITPQPLLLDPDSGILIFIPEYGGVSESSPPKVTFYSYVGLIGNPGIANLQDL